jgi:hypothetical protein
MLSDSLFVHEGVFPRDSSGWKDIGREVREGKVSTTQRPLLKPLTNETDRLIVRMLREKGHCKGQTIAMHIGRTFEYTRSRLAQLRKLGWIGNDQKGYYLLPVS